MVCACKFEDTHLIIICAPHRSVRSSCAIGVTYKVNIYSYILFTLGTRVDAHYINAQHMASHGWMVYYNEGSLFAERADTLGCVHAAPRKLYSSMGIRAVSDPFCGCENIAPVKVIIEAEPLETVGLII